MESIITIATVLTMYFNAANDVNAPYLYNSDLEDGVIHKIEVYEQKAEGQLCAKMEYRYSYDEQGRLTTREVVRWDEAKKQWVNDFRHTYKYYKNGYNMETSKWDTTLQAYDLPMEVIPRQQPALHGVAGPDQRPSAGRELTRQGKCFLSLNILKTFK